jgi:hypothetical protein
MDRIEQDPGIEDTGRVERRLGRSERTGKRVGSLAVVPGTVVPTHRMVMGDGSSGRMQGLGDSGLYLVPLRYL